jgi:hypothetical protein
VGYHYAEHHGKCWQVGDGAMIEISNLKTAASRRIWYLVESAALWDGRDIRPAYDIKSEFAVRHDLSLNERVINEEPLTMAEAKAFKKLLTGVQS